jgi:cobalt-zinc-cadmium efflux system protein
MSAGHGHSHGESSERGLQIALALTASILVVEAVGAVVTNSLALLSDAAHMLTDVTALVIALLAARLSRRPADNRRTFGYYRLEILAAAANAVALGLAAVYILYEAAQRFQNPQPIASTGMLIVALFGLAANLASMRVLHSHAGHSLNLKGAYLEVWSDALGSAGVIAAAGVIQLTEWTPVDPIVAVLIGLWVLPRSWSLLSESVNILLEGVPRGLELDAIHASLMGIPGVGDVHDLHVWSITTGKNTLTAHLTLDNPAIDPQSVLQRANQAIESFGITHSTVQIETVPCHPDPNHHSPTRIE